MKFWIWWLPQKANPRGSTIGWQWHREWMRDYGGNVKIDDPNQILFFPRLQPPYYETWLQGLNQTMEHQDRANGAWGNTSNRSIIQNSCGEIGISTPGAMLGLW